MTTKTKYDDDDSNGLRGSLKENDDGGGTAERINGGDKAGRSTAAALVFCVTLF
ncbi:hypothetical protein TSUD_214400 [Trifolium subterraneum]|uniref:Uncharacterized protein n=1 Tax=Trifolium subterraneum TaxID=3900 RepID=A0A2Z6N2D5_TRISU|nr:hypothetical protein TSUD_214400 [Trifolium subterraneum]